MYTSDVNYPVTDATVTIMLTQCALCSVDDKVRNQKFLHTSDVNFVTDNERTNQQWHPHLPVSYRWRDRGWSEYSDECEYERLNTHFAYCWSVMFLHLFYFIYLFIYSLIHIQ